MLWGGGTRQFSKINIGPTEGAGIWGVIPRYTLASHGLEKEGLRRYLMGGKSGRIRNGEQLKLRGQGLDRCTKGGNQERLKELVKTLCEKEWNAHSN